MLRNQRTTFRITLVAVLLAAFAGAWFAASTLHVGDTIARASSFYDEGNWVESLSVFAEQAIEFILGWTQ